MNGLRWLALVLAAPTLTVGGGAARQEIAVSVHLDRQAATPSPLLHGWSLPAPGTPGAAALLPNLLRNASFEMTPPGKPLRLPAAWGKAEGWELRSCGARRILVRTRRGSTRGDDVLLLARRKQWSEYRLGLLGRKIAGPGGLCVLFEVRDRKTHFRWTLGGLGNRYHVLEKVHGGEAERLGPAVVGRIDAGRAYKIEVHRRKRVTRFLLDGRLVHSIKDRMPWGGIGLADADATAEYLDLIVYGRYSTPRFMLDHPAEARRSTVAGAWEPLVDSRNKVAFKWDTLYPRNSHFCQSIRVLTYVGGDAGIRQRGVAVKAPATYRGRVHLRAQGSSKVEVSLRSRSGQVLARQVLAEPPERWQACDFDLKPSADDPAADFCISASAGASVWVDQVSLVAADRATPYGLRRGAVDALRRLKPPTLLWPGGPGLLPYDWRGGVGPRDERPVDSATDGPRGGFEAAPNGFGTDEFLALCKSLGVEPMLAVNPRRGLRPALYWLDYCNAEANTPMGKLRVDHGRVEPYGATRWAIGGLPLDELEPERYAEDVGKIAEAMREQDPSVSVLPLVWEPETAAELVGVEAAAAPTLRVAAGRSGGRIAVRLVHLGDGEAKAHVAIQGLGERRLAPEADHLSMPMHTAATATRLAQAKLAVAGNACRLSLGPRSTHVVVLRLEGGSP